MERTFRTGGRMKVMSSGFLRYNATVINTDDIITPDALFKALLKPHIIVRKAIDTELAKYGFVTTYKNQDLFLTAVSELFALENFDINSESNFYEIPQTEQIFIVKLGTNPVDLSRDLEPIISKFVRFVAQGIAAQTGKKPLGFQKIFAKLKEVFEIGPAAATRKYGNDLYMSIACDLREEMYPNEERMSPPNAELKKEVTEGKPGLIFAGRTIFNLLRLVDDTELIKIILDENPDALLTKEMILPLLKQSLSDGELIKELKDTCSASSFKVRRPSFVSSVVTADQEEEQKEFDFGR